MGSRRIHILLLYDLFKKMHYLRVVAGRLLRVFPAAIDSNALLIKIYTLRRHIVDKKRHDTADYRKAKVVV